jgi:hypothetical protein
MDKKPMQLSTATQSLPKNLIEYCLRCGRDRGVVMSRRGVTVFKDCGKCGRNHSAVESNK